MEKILWFRQKNLMLCNANETKMSLQYVLELSHLLYNDVQKVFTRITHVSGLQIMSITGDKHASGVSFHSFIQSC
jgi:metal-dependent HD superfamily phosphatase/phosphodiesterase